MTTTDDDDALIYSAEEPDIKTLAHEYEETLGQLDEYFETCATSYNDRRNLWPGKSDDLRKHVIAHKQDRRVIVGDRLGHEPGFAAGR